MGRYDDRLLNDRLKVIEKDLATLERKIDSLLGITATETKTNYPIGRVVTVRGNAETCYGRHGEPVLSEEVEITGVLYEVSSLDNNLPSVRIGGKFPRGIRVKDVHFVTR